VHIEIRGDDEDGWFLEHVGPERVTRLHVFTGPFETRADAARALPDYRRAIVRAATAP
jgi:hypothetical protein